MRVRHFILPSILPIVLLSLLAPLWGVLAIPALGWLGVCIAYGCVLGVKNRDICAAGAGYCAIVMQFAWSLGHWRELISLLGQSVYQRIAAWA